MASSRKSQEKAPTLTATLRSRFGLGRLRPIQRQVIERVMAGGDAIVVLPTGGGKSLCFQLPAVALPQPGTTLVFSPLIALMEDQVSALKQRGIKATYINSTLSRRERDARQRSIAKGAHEIIYATPERMEKPAFLEALAAIEGGVKLLAIDEAHCISRWGHDLRPAYQRVGRFRKAMGNPVTIALTATATQQVVNDVRRTLGVEPRSMPLFTQPIERPNLALEWAEVWDDDQKIEQITKVVTAARGTSIVYCARITDLDHLAGLARPLLDGPVAIYHGQLPARRKKSVYRQFIDAKPSERLTLFATNAFGMGVDKPDIRAIVHAQVPGSVEAYFQEVGRAGRDGKRARCLLLYGPDDLAIQQPGLDGHSNGAEQIACRARDCGMQIDYDGIRLTPAEIVASAQERRPHVIGLSILSGSHIPLVAEVMVQLRAAGLGDIPVIIGGIIPDEDADFLKKNGVSAIYTPKDFELNQIMRDIVRLAESQQIAAE